MYTDRRLLVQILASTLSLSLPPVLGSTTSDPGSFVPVPAQELKRAPGDSIFNAKLTSRPQQLAKRYYSE